MKDFLRYSAVRIPMLVASGISIYVLLILSGIVKEEWYNNMESIHGMLVLIGLEIISYIILFISHLIDKKLKDK